MRMLFSPYLDIYPSKCCAWSFCRVTVMNSGGLLFHIWKSTAAANSHLHLLVELTQFGGYNLRTVAVLPSVNPRTVAHVNIYSKSLDNEICVIRRIESLMTSYSYPFGLDITSIKSNQNFKRSKKYLVVFYQLVAMAAYQTNII